MKVNTFALTSVMKRAKNAYTYFLIIQAKKNFLTYECFQCMLDSSNGNLTGEEIVNKCIDVLDVKAVINSFEDEWSNYFEIDTPLGNLSINVFDAAARMTWGLPWYWNDITTSYCDSEDIV